MTDSLPISSEPISAPQVVPHSREAEEAVIGAILINPDAYYDVIEFLQAEDFYLHKHRWIFEAFNRLHEQRTPVDLLTVTEELDQMGYLGEIGGSAYLTALIANVPTALHATAYGHLVENTALRRRMIEAANDIVKTAYKDDITIETAINAAEKAVFSVSERRLSSDLQPIKKVLSDYFDRVGDLASRDAETYGVPTNFRDLDNLLGGLQPSDLLIIAGRPGQGKTSFMLSIAKNAARLANKHIAIFSMEMSNEQLVQRLISQETGIDAQRLRLGKLHDDEWTLFAEAVDTLGRTRIFLDDTPSITPTQVRAKCRRLHLEHRLDLVVIDYLQLMQGDTRTENRVQEVSYISRNLKTLARELNVPVLAAAQLSRAIEQRADKHPVLSDLRESGSLEQDADIVMFIYREDKENEDTLMKNVAQIIVSKHRNGPTGKVSLVFREHLAQFVDAVTYRFDQE
ncbi:MAG: replicative DNA helicase [Anaerolineales bacterium]|nr:replicative DNA helicase [Anaerolineales bacterium]